MPERVQYKLGVIMYSCFHGQAPRYLTDFCIPVSGVSARQHLRSATRNFLVVLRCRLSTLVSRSFSVAVPSLWNFLPDSLREPDLGRDSFRHLLKTHILHCTEAFSILEMFQDNTLYKLTYLLTCATRCAILCRIIPLAAKMPRFTILVPFSISEVSMEPTVDMAAMRTPAAIQTFRRHKVSRMSDCFAIIPDLDLNVSETNGVAARFD